MIAVIDYGAGNTQSVVNVLDELNVEYLITNREIDINKCRKIIFPGVGEASFAIKQLHLLNLFTMLRVTRKPLLGICIGMQLLCERSDEGNSACLGIIPATVHKFDESQVKVPHMGWNKVAYTNKNKLFEGIPEDTYFYFANSYYVPLNIHTSAKTEHGIEFSSAVEKENFYGVQFHPEKSGDPGIHLIKNFIELC